MKTRHTGIVAASLILLSAQAVMADSSRGGSFRLPGYGAHAWGMAGAAVASVDDESVVEWNPARLALISNAVAGASYVNLVPGATAWQSQVAYARMIRPLEAAPEPMARHAVGAQYTNLHVVVAGGESYDENHLRLAYAYTPDAFITFAAAAELFLSRSDVDNFGAKGTSVDFALRVQLTETFEVGLVGRNMFSRYSFDSGEDFKKERNVTLGASSTAVPRVRLEADLVFDHGSYARTLVGAESDYLLGYLSIRAGYAALRSGDTRSIPYFGAGVRGPNERLVFHYAAGFDDGDEAFGDIHRFSIGLWF